MNRDVRCVQQLRQDATAGLAARSGKSFDGRVGTTLRGGKYEMWIP